MLALIQAARREKPESPHVTHALLALKRNVRLDVLEPAVENNCSWLTACQAGKVAVLVCRRGRSVQACKIARTLHPGSLIPSKTSQSRQASCHVLGTIRLI